MPSFSDEKDAEEETEDGHLHGVSDNDANCPGYKAGLDKSSVVLPLT